MQVTLHVNGKAQAIEVDDPGMPLLYALRDDLGLSNPRFGCGLGQCGACTVHVDGRAVRSCVTPAAAVAGRQITTLAGLGTPEHPHPVQAAWIEEQVNQCAYCINGWIMTAAELLAHNPHPTEPEIKDALGDLICRCGTHAAALRAVKRAAQSA
ncbi:MAG TPA: (2Fe-2S)-binding protein [Xanthobacteraceae bacterium]|jgi:nicotinate dehydrogenase subunit A